jgi:TolB-like 6-blade propeller-like
VNSGRPTVASRHTWRRTSPAWLLLPVLLGAGCRDRIPDSRGEAVLTPRIALPAVLPLAGRILTESDSLGLPRQLAVTTAGLVVLDAAGDPAVRVFSERNGSLIASGGRRGAGPGEFEGAWSVDPGRGQRDFWIYDLGLSRLTHLQLVARSGSAGDAPHLASLAPGAIPAAPPPDSLAVLSTLNISVDGTVFDPAWVGRRLVGVGFFRSGRLAYFQADGRLLRFAGRLPPAPAGLPRSVWTEAFQSMLQPAPGGDLLAVAARYTDRIDVYTSTGTLVAHAARPYGFDPPVAVSKLSPTPALATGPDLRFGYVGLAVTRNRIYGLFSGRRRRDAPGRANFGELVNVFDWQGHLLRILKLPRPALVIAVDDRAHKLFAVHHDPRPMIVSYPLPTGDGADNPM